MRTNGAQGGGDEAASADPLQTVLPGDAIDIWLEGSLVVNTVFRCKEMLDDETIEWRWFFTDDGSLFEVSLDGHYRYKEHRIINQGSALFEEISAKDGALVRFEEHVREGASGRRPVLITIDDKEYRITSTGTVAVQKLGPDPEPQSWKDFSQKPEENVYFGMVEVADEDNVGVGLWTSHICLSLGRAFEPSDITSVYHKGP